MDAKYIKRTAGAELEDWRRWLDKELSPPVVDGIKNNPDVIRVLKAFRELIVKVQHNNERIKETKKTAQDIFAEIEDYVSDRW